MTPEELEEKQKVTEQRRWLEELEREEPEEITAEALDVRDPGFRQNGDRYVLSLGDEQIRLNLREATSLAAHLFTHLPNVVNGPELAEIVRRTPTLRLYKLYSHEAGKVRQDRYRCEVRLHGRSLYLTKTHDQPGAAQLAASQWYGAGMNITKVIDSKASRKKAEEEKVLWAARQYAREEGISMDELWKRAAQEQG